MKVIPEGKPVFVMMPFGSGKKAERHYTAIWREIRTFMRGMGLDITRADDGRADQSLWKSITRQMERSWAGIAVLDGGRVRGHAGNILIEIGYMLCRGKPVLLLREKGAAPPPSDLSFMLHEQYSFQTLDVDLSRALSKWLGEQQVLTPGVIRLLEEIQSVDSSLLNDLVDSGAHVAVVNFGHPDQAFRHYVRLTCRILSTSSGGSHVHVILKPCHPKLLVESIVSVGLPNQAPVDRISVRLRVKNGDAAHLPTQLDPEAFAHQWFEKIRSQVPKGSKCVVLCENTSDYMKGIRNKQAFVQFETRLGEHLRTFCSGRSVAVVCTYDWSDVRSMIRSPGSRNLARIARIIDSHDEVITFGRNGRVLWGEPARKHVTSSLKRHVRHLGGCAA